MRQYGKILKAAVAATLALSVWAWAPSAATAGDDAKIAVVELFTSQGCSSCPPADRVLGELANDPNVLALSMNVDYWDYLGWKDTVGSPEHSRRQREYAVRRGDGRVYTPQVVVSGGNHVIGSYKGRVQNEIKSVLSKPADTFVPVNITAKGEQVTIEVGSADGVAAKDATVWLMLITRKVEQKIRRGENLGRKIAYHNVVRKMLPVGMWKGKSMTVSLPKSGLMVEGVEDCVAVLQVDGTGPIIGASRLRDLTTATN